MFMHPIFELLQLSIGTREGLSRQLSAAEWEEAYQMSVRNGVTAVVFEGVMNLPKAEVPDVVTTMRWFAAATNVERKMKEMKAVAEEFAGEMAKRQIPLVVLKGLAFAQYYPHPLHREYGDLDCYLMGKKKEGDRVVEELGGTVEEAGYKHSHLRYKGLIIENHRFFTDFDNTPTGILTEQVLSELMQEGHTSIGNSKLHCPSPNFNAVFLLKHAQHHFILEGIRLRHVLDWALFLRAKQKEIGWSRVLPMLQITRTIQFAGIMTAIAVQHFHIKVQDKGLLALVASAEQKMVDAVLADTMGEQPAIYVDGLWHKARRIFRRFRRMWKFRDLASETYPRMIWNAFAFSSYMKRMPFPPL